MRNQTAQWAGVKFGEKQYFNINSFLLSKTVLSFAGMADGFDDMINTLKSDLRRYIMVGTEKGRIYVIDMLENRVVSCIDCDPWLNSIFLAGSCIFASGFSRKIEGYNLLSNKKTFSLDSGEKPEAFWHKGIMFEKLTASPVILANSGYLKFRVISTLTRKQLKVFTVTIRGMKNFSSAELGKPVLLNFAVIRSKQTIVGFMVRGDPNLYFYDVKLHRMVKELSLYSAESLAQGTFLCNTVLLSCNDYFVTILQFRKNTKAGSQVKSILYLCRRRDLPNCETIEYMFYVVLPELEVIISHDVKEITEQVAGVSHGLTLVLGSSNGVSRVLSLDFHKKCYVQRSVMKKSPGSNLALTRRRSLRSGHLQKWDHFFHRRWIPHPAAR